MSKEGCHGTEAKIFSGVQVGGDGDVRRPGVSVSQVETELGIGATVLGRWWCELRQE